MKKSQTIKLNDDNKLNNKKCFVLPKDHWNRVRLQRRLVFAFFSMVCIFLWHSTFAWNRKYYIKRTSSYMCLYMYKSNVVDLGN